MAEQKYIEYDDVGCILGEDGEPIDDEEHETDEDGNLVKATYLPFYISVNNAEFAREAARKIGVPYATYLLYILRLALYQAEKEPMPDKEDVIVLTR